MGMTPRGLRRLDEGARITEAEERRLAVMRARRKLDAALEADDRIASRGIIPLLAELARTDTE